MRQIGRGQAGSTIGLYFSETLMMHPIFPRLRYLLMRFRNEVPPHHDGFREGLAADHQYSRIVDSRYVQLIAIRAEVMQRAAVDGPPLHENIALQNK